MKPTEEQIEEFWKRLEQERENQSEYGRLPDWTYPKLNLTNIFKYAIPKLFSYSLKTFHISDTVKKHEASATYKNRWSGFFLDEDPTLALFWAIYNVIS